MTKFAELVAQQEEQRRSRTLVIPFLRQWHLRAWNEKNYRAMDLLSALILRQLKA